jgi:glycerol-3-phosphate acyltransferase PlsY
MTPTLLGLSVLVVGLAYFVGAIPFAYLLVKWREGIDVRTVGSGNVGATNAGRVLGFRYFLLIFALDVLKGLAPTLALPRLVEWLAGSIPPGLPVAVALATILGHNFPVYLRFKGGKGVATSLGAMAALDPPASLAALLGFLLFLLVTRYVSLSSIGGALAWLVVHFGRVEKPLGQDQVALTVLAGVLFVMLVIRHRKNYVRVLNGTEPKVSFRLGRSRAESQAGRISLALLLTLAALGLLAGFLGWRMSDVSELSTDRIQLVQLDRVGTGHQRADDVVLADGGRTVVVACPRYSRVVFYRVTDTDGMQLLRDVKVEGRPVALCAGRDRVYVLQRPAGDARHLEEAYWQTFDFEGRLQGSKTRVGWDADDLAIAPDGSHAFVLTSGHAEGESNRPLPALHIYRLQGETPVRVSRLEFGEQGDDPHRIYLSNSGRYATVSLFGSHQVAALDLSDPANPRLVGRQPLLARRTPSLSEDPQNPGDSVLMPVDTEREAVVLGSGLVISTLPRASALEVLDSSRAEPLGRLSLRGAANLGSVIPTALDYSENASRLVVATRSGAVYLIRVTEQSSPAHSLVRR